MAGVDIRVQRRQQAATSFMLPRGTEPVNGVSKDVRKKVSYRVLVGTLLKGRHPRKHGRGKPCTSRKGHWM